MFDKEEEGGTVMKIQLLSFAGCPNSEEARESLRRALIGSGLSPEFEEVDVMAPATPEPLKAWGSPTILVNGRDVGGDAPTGPCCRVYGAGEQIRGVPTETQIREAIRNARSGSGQM